MEKAALLQTLVEQPQSYSGENFKLFKTDLKGN